MSGRKKLAVDDMSSYTYPNTEPMLALNLEDEDGMAGIDDLTAQPVEDDSAFVNDNAWFGQGHNLAIGNGAQPSVAHLTSGMQSTADAMPRQTQLFHDDTTYQRRALRYALSGVGIMDASMSMAGPSQSDGSSSIGSGSSAAVPVGSRAWQDDGVAPAIDSFDPHFLLGNEFWVDCNQSGESRVDAYVNEQSSFQYTTDVPIDRSPEKTAYNTSLAPSRQAQEHPQLSPSPLLTAQYSRAHRHDQTYGPSAEPWNHVFAIASADGGQRQRPSVTHYVGSSTSLPTSRLSLSYNSTKASDATNDATTDTSLGPDGLGDSVATLVPVATQACGMYGSPDDLSVASTEWNHLDDEDVEGMDPGFEQGPSIHADDTSWFVRMQLAM